MPEEPKAGCGFLDEYMLRKFGAKLVKVQEVSLAVFQDLEEIEAQRVDWSQFRYKQFERVDRYGFGDGKLEYIVLQSLDIKTFKIVLEEF